MSRILIIQPNSFVESLISTSVLKLWDNREIDWIGNKETLSLFKHSDVNFYALDEFKKLQSYDIVINFGVDKKSAYLCQVIDSPVKFGYTLRNNKIHFDNSCYRHYNCFFLKSKIDCNQFQIFYSFVKESWRGEGYQFRYYPKTKSSKNGAGVLTKNTNREQNIKKLNIPNLNSLTFSDNVFEQMDIINTCRHIITDDELILHLSIILKKKIYYVIDTAPLFKIETFDLARFFYTEKK